MDDNFRILLEMFPSVEPAIIQEIYFQDADCDKDAAIEFLLPVSNAAVPDPLTLKRKISLSCSETFPHMTDNDGWQIVPRSVEMGANPSVGQDTATESWADVVKGGWTLA